MSPVERIDGGEGQYADLVPAEVATASIVRGSEAIDATGEPVGQQLNDENLPLHIAETSPRPIDSHLDEPLLAPAQMDRLVLSPESRVKVPDQEPPDQIPADESAVDTTRDESRVDTVRDESPVGIARDVVRVARSGSDSNSGAAGSPVASFEQALQLVAPGGEIQFEPGNYGPIELVGVKDLTLRGEPGVVISDNDYGRRAAIHIEDSIGIEIESIAVNRSLWGIYISDSHGVTVRQNSVHDIGQEAIRLKDGTSDVLIVDNTISETGRRSVDSNGEGIYVGTGSPSGLDFVSNVVIEGNRISHTTDEAIDVKTPSVNVTIRNNEISDIVTQTSGAIVVHLNAITTSNPGITIAGNQISNVSRSSEFRDGNCIVAYTTVTVVDNQLVDCEHRGIYLAGTAGVATVTNNRLTRAGSIGGIVDEGRGMIVDLHNNIEFVADVGGLVGE